MSASSSSPLLPSASSTPSPSSPSPSSSSTQHHYHQRDSQEPLHQYQQPTQQQQQPLLHHHPQHSDLMSWWLRIIPTRIADDIDLQRRFMLVLAFNVFLFIPTFTYLLILIAINEAATLTSFIFVLASCVYVFLVCSLYATLNIKFVAAVLCAMLNTAVLPLYLFYDQYEVATYLVLVPIFIFAVFGPKQGLVATVTLVTQLIAMAYVSSHFKLEPPEWMPVASRFMQSQMGRCLSLNFFLLALCSMCMIYDATQSVTLDRLRIALAEKEQANVKMKRATDAKTKFLANMTHEVRTPMHGIVAMSKELLAGATNDAMREAAQIVSDCADHLLALLDDILDFERIESNQLELEEIPFSLDQEVNSVVNMLTLTAQNKRLTVTVEQEVARDMHVGDPLRFRQIVFNLLSNAIKFTPEEGSIWIEVHNEPANPDLVTVLVKDTGIGIPYEKLNHLFKSFSQLDTSIGRKYGGSGLGLAISKRLCEAMHGDISCTSSPGEGTTFSFSVTIPAVQDAQSEEQPTTTVVMKRTRSNSIGAPGSDEIHEELKGAKVMLVEDNFVNQKVGRKLLESLGCDVTLAGDGMQCLDLIKENPDRCDVILMDCQMPVLDGFDATTWIRELENEWQSAAGSGLTTKDEGSTSENVKENESDQKNHEGEEEKETKEEELQALLSGSMKVKNGERQHGSVRPRDPAKGRLAIVALTASATKEYRERCLQCGMDDFLTKPLKKKSLQAALSRWLRPSKDKEHPA